MTAGKTTVGGTPTIAARSVKQITTSPVLKGLPGHYWFGAYWSPWDFPQFGNTETATNSHGFYWHADQMIYQEASDSDQGLTIWSALVLSPQQNIAKLPFQVNGGLASATVSSSPKANIIILLLKVQVLFSYFLIPGSSPLEFRRNEK